MEQIVFDEIPYDWREPGTFLEAKPNYRTMGILPWPVKNLIVGQKLATGTLTPGDMVEIVRPDEAIALFGLGSIGAEQVAAFRKANSTQPLFVMALADDAGGVAATGTITFAGAVAAAVVLRFKIAGKQVRMTAAAGASVTDLATALKNAINADTSLPVTANSALGVVTVTSRHKGEVGNEIDMRVDWKEQPLPSGLTATVVAMSGGTGNPDLTDALDAIGNTWVTALQHPYADATNMAAAAAWATGRYMAMAKRDVQVYAAKRGSFAELGTFGDLTNSPFLTVVGLDKSPTSAWAISAALMGLCSFHLANDPARQLRSLVLPGVDAPDPIDQFIDTERNLLLGKGVSTLTCLDDGTVTVSRVITTYKKSSLNIDDEAWMDIMVPATVSRIRYDWSSYVTLLYPRSKLVDDESSAALTGRSNEDEDPGSAVVTPRRMKASWGARCRLYGDRAWIEDIERTVKESIFQRNADDKNRLDSRQQIRIVGNLMVLAGSLEFQV